MNEKTYSSQISVYKICALAIAICINLVGGQIALVLRLPIYLDSIGTIFIGATLGPFYGMLPNLLSGLLMGFTTDIYSLYYAPVGIILGLVTGFVWKKKSSAKWWIFLGAFLITVPTTIISASITAGLFGGITSSGSTIIVQILAKTPLGLTGSCFVVQFITDYIDRVISLFLAIKMLQVLPESILGRFRTQKTLAK